MYTLNPFRLRRALRALADAVAQTLPGAGWSDEIDEALLEATALVGPMDDDKVLEAILGRREADCQEAYEQGCDTTEAEYQEAFEHKNAFIDQQAELITRLFNEDLIRVAALPEDLRNRLADYV